MTKKAIFLLVLLIVLWTMLVASLIMSLLVYGMLARVNTLALMTLSIGIVTTLAELSDCV